MFDHSALLQLCDFYFLHVWLQHIWLHLFNFWLQTQTGDSTSAGTRPDSQLDQSASSCSFYLVNNLTSLSSLHQKPKDSTNVHSLFILSFTPCKSIQEHHLCLKAESYSLCRWHFGDETLLWTKVFRAAAWAPKQSPIFLLTSCASAHTSHSTNGVSW